MRLTENQRQAIVESVRCAFGPAAKTYLFGSRVDDGKYGGDIDLLVEAPMPKSEWLEPTIRAVSMIQRRIGERKIDMVVTDGSPKPFLDILNRLEQLRVLESVDTWQFFRTIRNRIAHDYPESVTQTVQTVNLLYSQIDRFLDLYRTARAFCVTRLSS